MEAGVIVVGIDFSDSCAVAVERAREFARAARGRLVALHISDRDDWSLTPERLEWLSAVGLAPDEVVVRTGLSWLQLARFADETRPAMLVIGTHGRGGFHPVAPGSTATMLLTRVRVPVLVVPPHPLAARSEPATSDPWRHAATRTPPL